MDDGRVDDASHRWQRVEERVAVAGGREAAVEHGDDAAVVAAADEAAGALREHERGGGQIDVAEPRPAGALRGLAAGLGQRVVGSA